MVLYQFHLHCQRVDANLNMARYYLLSIRSTLFGEIVVVRTWGRMGTAGREKSDVFGTEQEAAAHFLRLVRKKRQKGYMPVASRRNADGDEGRGVPLMTAQFDG